MLKGLLIVFQLRVKTVFGFDSGIDVVSSSIYFCSLVFHIFRYVICYLYQLEKSYCASLINVSLNVK